MAKLYLMSLDYKFWRRCITNTCYTCSKHR